MTKKRDKVTETLWTAIFDRAEAICEEMTLAKHSAAKVEKKAREIVALAQTIQLTAKRRG